MNEETRAQVAWMTRNAQQHFVNCCPFCAHPMTNPDAPPGMLACDNFLCEYVGVPFLRNDEIH